MTAGIPTNAHTITAADGTLVAVPDEYVCPLTLDVMQEPFLSPEGHNYERDAIMKWVAEYGSSPLTREKLLPAYLSRNRALEMKIRLFLMQNGVNVVPVVGGKDCSVQESLTLHSLTSATLQSSAPASSSSSSSSSAPQQEAQPVSEEHLAERRQQIANLIGLAMSELDDL